MELVGVVVAAAAEEEEGEWVLLLDEVHSPE